MLEEEAISRPQGKKDAFFYTMGRKRIFVFSLLLGLHVTVKLKPMDSFKSFNHMQMNKQMVGLDS